MLTVLNETAVRLVWSPPDNPNGIIIEYQAIYYGLITLTETQKKQVSDHNLKPPGFEEGLYYYVKLWPNIIHIVKSHVCKVQ